MDRKHSHPFPKEGKGWGTRNGGPPTDQNWANSTIANDRQFRSFCRAAGREDLGNDPRFCTNADRVAQREILIGVLKPVLESATTSGWISLLEAANVPCGPINRIDEVFGDRQALARGFRVSLDHATAGPIDLVASPLRLQRTPPEYRNAPPLLGQHTEEVLRDVLNLNADDIAALRGRAIV